MRFRRDDPFDRCRFVKAWEAAQATTGAFNWGGMQRNVSSAITFADVAANQGKVAW
jgi:hypothetical protein